MVNDHVADVGLASRLIVGDSTLVLPVFKTEYVLLLPTETALPEGPVRPDQLDPRYEVNVTSWTGETRRWHDAYWDPYEDSYLQVDNNHMSHHYLTDPRCWALCPAAIAFSICGRRRDQLTIRRLAFDPPMHRSYLVVQRAQMRNRKALIEQLHQTILDYAGEAPLLEPVLPGESAQ